MMTMRKTVFVGLLAACFGLAGQVRAKLGREVKEELGEMKHALGWDSMSLKHVEEDKGGRPTLERDANAANRIERKTGYHSNGVKASQELSVTDKKSGKRLYVKNEAWDDKGVLQSSLVEDDAFNGDGKQAKGYISEKKYEKGRLVSELEKKYSADSGDWSVTYKQETSYYDDGDKKERYTERPGRDEKRRETWSAEKGTLGRDKTVKSWDSSKGDWK